jgi:predicted nucleic acid-binding protein
MKQVEGKPASVGFIAEKIAKLEIAFYETPERLFDALVKTILFLEMTEYEVAEMVNEAIFTIKKTKITIADIINGRNKENKKTVAYI